MNDRMKTFLEGLVNDGDNVEGVTHSDLRDWTLANAEAAKIILLSEARTPRFIGASLNAGGGVVAVDDRGTLWLSYQSTKTNKWVPWEALPSHPGTA